MRWKRTGFTFFELMIAAVILGAGIVMIYRSFWTCLDFQKHMVYYAYATNLLEHKIAALQFAFQQDKEPSVTAEGEIENIVLNDEKTPFHFRMAFRPVLSLPNIQQVDMSLAWRERQRKYRVKRSVYISRF